MKKIILLTVILTLTIAAHAQVTTTPAIIQQGYKGEVIITFNPNEGNKGMVGSTECYLYSCVEVDNSGKWEYELAPWPSKLTKTQLTKDGNKWTITIPNLYTFYGVPEGKTITNILLLFTDGKKDGKAGRGPNGDDIIIPLIKAGEMHATITITEGELVEHGSTINIVCNSTTDASLSLTQNGTEVKTASGKQLTYSTTVTYGDYKFEVTATADNGTKATTTASTCVANAPTAEQRPEGIVNGIYYDNNDQTKVTLCTYAASKTEAAKNVFVVGDFNDWTISNAYQMRKDGNYFWIEIDGLTPQKEYALQYVVRRSDGTVIRISDLFSEKLLHPDDHQEPKTTDPSLMDYPHKGNGYVTVIKTGKTPYNWSDATLNFSRPDKNNLIIYELWIYDYTPQRNIAGLMKRLDYLQQLGVNAIELMPVTEFDGNKNWGYSPNHYFALDKAYGTPEEMKQLVDECHKRGMAVILDMVFNHATGENPMNKLYPYGTELQYNPWFNVTAPHKEEDGNTEYYQDWNHDFDPVRDMFRRALQYWLTEYKVDGFRMDLSHGFCGPDCSHRYEWLKEYYEAVKAVSSDAYFIQEYWGGSPSKQTIIDDGMLCWTGKSLNEAYGQLAMGYESGSSIYAANDDGYVSYNESHDEERNFYKVTQWGAGTLNTNEQERAKRIPAIMAFNTLLNGSHMMYMYGELGYEWSINSKEGVNDLNDKYRTDIKQRIEPLGWLNTGSLRMQQYEKVAQAIQLRTRLLPSVFEGNPTDAQLGSGLTKTITWGNEVFVAANFSAVAAVSVNLPSGTWYDYYGQTTANSSSVSLNAGEVKIFTGKKIPLPVINWVYSDLKDVIAPSRADTEARKFIIDGNMYIVRDGVVYDPLGRIVTKYQ